MSDFYTDADDTAWGQPDTPEADITVEAPGSTVDTTGSRGARARRGPRTTVTRSQAEAVLDRFEALSAATGSEREAVAVVLGIAAADARSLTVALASGAGVKHRQAMDDLLDVAARDEADRDMVALTLAVGKSGMKRLRTAYNLAANLKQGSQEHLSSNPVQAARDLSGIAVDVGEVLTAVRGLIG